MLNKNLLLLLTNHLNTFSKYVIQSHWTLYLTGLIQSCGGVYFSQLVDGWILNIKFNLQADIIDGFNFIKLQKFLKFKGFTYNIDLNKVIYSIQASQDIVKLYDFTLYKFHQPMPDKTKLITQGQYKLESTLNIYLLKKFNQLNNEYINTNLDGVVKFSLFRDYTVRRTISHYWLTGLLEGLLKKKDIIINLQSTNQIVSSIHNPFRLCNIEYSILLGTYDKILLIFILTEIFGINYTYVNYLSGRLVNNLRSREINYRNINLTRNINFETGNNSYKFKKTLSHANDVNVEIKVYTYTLLCTEFPNKNLIKFINHLDNYPLLSYKYIIYYKFRKIYRICQRKEYINKKGFLKILNIWFTGR
jgi:hypothetical protein